MKKFTAKTAEQTHANAMTDSLNLLNLIRDELIKHAEQDRDEGIHWAHAGSAQHYRGLLKGSLMQIMSRDDEDTESTIDKILTDLR